MEMPEKAFTLFMKNVMLYSMFEFNLFNKAIAHQTL